MKEFESAEFSKIATCQRKLPRVPEVAHHLPDGVRRGLEPIAIRDQRVDACPTDILRARRIEDEARLDGRSDGDHTPSLARGSRDDNDRARRGNRGPVVNVAAG